MEFLQWLFALDNIQFVFPNKQTIYLYKKVFYRYVVKIMKFSVHTFLKND